MKSAAVQPAASNLVVSELDYKLAEISDSLHHEKQRSALAPRPQGPDPPLFPRKYICTMYVHGYSPRGTYPPATSNGSSKVQIVICILELGADVMYHLLYHIFVHTSKYGRVVVGR